MRQGSTLAAVAAAAVGGGRRRQRATVACWLQHSGMPTPRPLLVFLPSPPTADPVDRRVSTVGRVHPWLEAKVVDPGIGRIVPLGTVSAALNGVLSGSATPADAVPACSTHRPPPPHLHRVLLLRSAPKVGELCVRGYSVMLGYWGDEASTAAVIDQARCWQWAWRCPAAPAASAPPLSVPCTCSRPSQCRSFAGRMDAHGRPRGPGCRGLLLGGWAHQ